MTVAAADPVLQLPMREKIAATRAIAHAHAALIATWTAAA